ncbi:unnamed protein product, partial [Coregonus sp. 'balchen']
QSSLRETGDALVELCRSEGLPTSLQRLLVAVDDILEQGRLTSLQAKQMSLLERVDALDQECEDIPEALCSELQQEKQRLESHVGKLKDSVDQLKGEVQELAQSERLLVVFPELNPLPQGPPKSRITSLNRSELFLYDMEQQLQANCVRIRVLEQENSTLRSSLVKLRDRAQHGAS